MFELEMPVYETEHPAPYSAHYPTVSRKRRYSKASFPAELAAALRREVNRGAVRAPLSLIIRYASRAEEQYHAINFFYKLLHERHPELIEKPPTAHNYRRITASEAQLIRQLRLQGVPLNRIAQRLGRHVSTIYYFCKRNNLLEVIE